MRKLTHVLFQMNASKLHHPMRAHHCRRFSRHFNFHLSTLADRLIELRNLVILGHIRVKVIFAVPFAHFGNLTTKQQSDPNGFLNGFTIHHRERSGQTQYHGISEGIGRLAESGAHTSEHLRFRVQLNVNFKTYDRFVFHLILEGQRLGACLPNSWA